MQEHRRIGLISWGIIHLNLNLPWSIPPDKRHHLATDSAKQRKNKDKEEIQKRRGKRVRWSVLLIACMTGRSVHCDRGLLQIKRPIEEEKQQGEAINGNNTKQMQPCA
jgi:hypothetical protein